jgi:hypothetical protein
MSSSFSVDGKEIVIRIIKYLLEGSAVAAAVALIPKKTPSIEEIIVIGLISAATFSILDMLAPSISTGFRTGVGFSLAGTMVGWPGNTMGR